MKNAQLIAISELLDQLPAVVAQHVHSALMHTPTADATAAARQIEAAVRLEIEKVRAALPSG